MSYSHHYIAVKVTFMKAEELWTIRLHFCLLVKAEA